MHIYHDELQALTHVLYCSICMHGCQLTCALWKVAWLLGRPVGLTSELDVKNVGPFSHSLEEQEQQIVVIQAHTKSSVYIIVHGYLSERQLHQRVYSSLE